MVQEIRYNKFLWKIRSSLIRTLIWLHGFYTHIILLDVILSVLVFTIKFLTFKLEEALKRILIKDLINFLCYFTDRMTIWSDFLSLLNVFLHVPFLWKWIQTIRIINNYIWLIFIWVLKFPTLMKLKCHWCGVPHIT